MLARLAWRNLWRNRRRTLITLVSIGFGCLLSVTFTTLSDGSYGRFIDAAARMGSGHITIEPQGYRDKPGADLVLSRPAELALNALNLPGITSAMVRIVGQAMTATAADSVGTAFVALDPGREQGRFFILDHIIAGAPMRSMAVNRVLIGSGMARQLELKVGKKLVVTTTDRYGQVVSGLFKVGGIFSTGITEVDNYLIVVPIDGMRRILGYTHGEANQVALFLNDRRDVPVLEGKLASLAAAHGGTAVPWEQTMPDVAGIITMDKVGNYFFQVFIFLLVGAGILNTVLMGVMERMREFGIMIALGMTPRRIWSMIMLEAFWLAVVGIVTGMLVCVPVFWYLHTAGLDLSGLFREKQVVGGVLMNPFVRAEFRLDHALNILAGVLALVMAAGLYPAFTAARTSPVETMKTL